MNNIFFKAQRFFLVSVMSLCFSFPLYADYSSHERAKSLIDEMVLNHDFNKAELEALIAKAERKERILELIAKPAEKRLEWFAYQQIFITEDRIKRGIAFLDQYKEALGRAEAEFGVPKEIIVAIIGVETRYGQHKGDHRVIDALATLGFDYPPRADFFYSELKHALLLAREQGFDMLSMQGSYAGAMGYGQFIPSSYRHYAIDFDQDNIADILNNPIDAIGSVANYFAKHHWKSEQPIAFLLSKEDLVSSFKQFLDKSLKPKLQLDDLTKAGIKVPNDLDPSMSAKIQHFLLEEDEEYWLTLHNFYVITRYNHSHLYAMAVFQLAKALGL